MGAKDLESTSFLQWWVYVAPWWGPTLFPLWYCPTSCFLGVLRKKRTSVRMSYIYSQFYAHELLNLSASMDMLCRPSSSCELSSSPALAVGQPPSLSLHSQKMISRNRLSCLDSQWKLVWLLFFFSFSLTSQWVSRFSCPSSLPLFVYFLIHSVPSAVPLCNTWCSWNYSSLSMCLSWTLVWG